MPLENSTSASPAALPSSDGRSSSGNDGSLSGGKPAGMAPRAATPLRSSPKAATAAPAPIKVTRAAGRRGARRAIANNAAMLAAATAKVGSWVCGSFVTISSSCGMTRLDSIGKPSTLPACPRQMLIATPLRNPTRMGFDRKSAIAPSRQKLAAIQNRPARKVRVMASDQ